MKKLKALLLISLFFQNPIFSQSITLTPGIEGNAQFPSLEYEQIISLANPKEGMIVYDKTYHCVRYYNGQRWLTSFQGNENIEPIVSAWVKKMTDYTWGDNIIFDFKSDANGNLYIMGNCHRNEYTTYSTYYYLIKLDKALNVKWNLSYSSSGGQFWDSGLINIDNVGNVYTFVKYYSASSSYSVRNLYLKKINKDGVEIYSKTYGLFDNIPEPMVVNTLYMDSQSNSYLSYTSYTSYNGIYDKYLIKVSSDGNILWIKNINNCKAITNKNGDTYIFGSFTGSKNFDGVWISLSCSPKPPPL